MEKKRSLKEIAREGVERNKQAKAAAPASPGPGNDDGERTELVKAACGHEIPFTLFPDAKDKYRKARREKLTSKPCGPCRASANAERARLQQEEAARRRKDKPKKGWRHNKAEDKGRLPDRSVFVTVYDATKQTWTGALVIGMPEQSIAHLRTIVEDNPRHEAEISGVHPLLSKLDALYRESLGAEKAAEPFAEEYQKENPS